MRRWVPKRDKANTEKNGLCLELVQGMQMSWHGVDLAGIGGMNEAKVAQAAPGGVRGDVTGLGDEVADGADAVVVVTGLPDGAGAYGASRVGIPSLDELNAFWGAYVGGRSDENMHVVRHDGEGVETELVGGPVTEKSFDEEMRVGFGGEVGMAIMG